MLDSIFFLCCRHLYLIICRVDKSITSKHCRMNHCFSLALSESYLITASFSQYTNPFSIIASLWFCQHCEDLSTRPHICIVFFVFQTAPVQQYTTGKQGKTLTFLLVHTSLWCRIPHHFSRTQSSLLVNSPDIETSISSLEFLPLALLCSLTLFTLQKLPLTFSPNVL